MIVLFALAAVGLIASLAAHVSTFFMLTPSIVWVLQFAAALIWLPFFYTDGMHLFRAQDQWNPGSHVPGSATTAGRVALGYALVNFFFTMLYFNQGGLPARVDDQYLLQTFLKGSTIRVLTAQEYVQHSVYLIRAASGYWIYLFFQASMFSFSKLRRARTTA